MTSFSKSYCEQLLGLEDGYKQKEIVTAFKTKAIQLHSSYHSTSIDLAEFSEICLAYEYLLHANEKLDYSKKHSGFITAKHQYTNATEWLTNRGEKARKRANKLALSNSNKFKIKLDQLTAHSTGVLITLIAFGIALFFVFGIPIIGYVYGGVKGLGIALLFLFLSLPFTGQALFGNRPTTNPRLMKLALVNLIESSRFHYGLTILFNAAVFLIFGLNTLIPMWLLLTAYCLCIATAFVFLKLLKLDALAVKTTFISLPSTISLLIILNYSFSSNEQKEDYSFNHEMAWYGTNSSSTHFNSSPSTGKGPHLENIAYIHLENLTYDDFPGIRMFLDFEAMKNANHITYYFEDGLLGFRVLKKYEFRKIRELVD